ncbi:MAG: ribosome recycling factor [Candidatus Dormibacter sp.]|uniref:ribosome recycling factor n=1 Tax=Candidatus Dormibacter sp. TaxID=2973982 RepID=UPI000DB779A4|nr:MAG: ribosome recycling factor [Candidatus Dormibacteraeota bacterium]
MAVDGILKDAEAKMGRSLEHLEHELLTIRTGRANPALLDRVQVPYYGTLTPLNQLAQISSPEARLLVVQVYDRGQLGVTEKAIRESGLGLNPANDGQLIRVPIPPLTEERRREYVKMAKQRAEEARVAVRNIRREELHRVQAEEKAGEIAEDQARRAGERLQKLTDTYVAKIEGIAQRKEAEVMEV